MSEIKPRVLAFLRENPLLVAGSILLLVFVLLLWWELPRWLLASSKDLFEPGDLIKLQNDIRVGFVQALGGAVLLAGLFFTWRSIRVTEENLRLSQETTAKNLELTREGQITERFTKAVNQLGESGPEKLAICLGGIYALERIARDSERDHWPIIEILTAYVRINAPWPPKDGQPDTQQQIELKPPPDIQAILTVLGRRTRTYKAGEDHPLDLRKTDLRGTNLESAHLEGAVLTEAHLEQATLVGAHLDGASLMRAYLQEANLAGAYLKQTAFIGAHIEGAGLHGAFDLTQGQVTSAHGNEDTLLPDNLDRPRLWKARDNYPLTT